MPDLEYAAAIVDGGKVNESTGLSGRWGLETTGSM
jgi:hypothetical protein